jgi:uncharacterized protein YjbI with pentapeptide repeats
MADPNHIAELRKGVAAWNAWRAKNPDIWPDLSEADLRNANLSRANLRDADLSTSFLSRAVLIGAECSSETNFSGARLVYADFSG